MVSALHWSVFHMVVTSSRIDAAQQIWSWCGRSSSRHRRTNCLRQQYSEMLRAAWPTGLSADTDRCVCCSREQGVCAVTDRKGDLTRDIKSTVRVSAEWTKLCGFHCSKLKASPDDSIRFKRDAAVTAVWSSIQKLSPHTTQDSVNTIQDWLWPRRVGTSNLLLVIMPCHHSSCTCKTTGVSLSII